MATVVWHITDHHPEKTTTDKKQQDALKLMILRYDLSKNGDGCLQDPKLDARTAWHCSHTKTDGLVFGDNRYKLPEASTVYLEWASASKSVLSGSSSVAAIDCKKEIAAEISNMTAPTTAMRRTGILKQSFSGNACKANISVS